MTPRSARLALVLSVASAAGAFLASPAAAEPDPPPRRPRVVVLGFDGLDWNEVERLVAAKKLPALAKLRERGGASSLAASNPAQSPVSWASIATGANPGRTGIYDFLRRKDLDPSAIRIALAEPRDAEPLAWWVRAGLVFAAGALGAVTGAAAVLAAAAVRPAARKGKRLETVMTLVGAVFAAAAFVVLRWVPETVPRAVNLRTGEPFWVTLDRAGVRTIALDAPLSFPPDEMTEGCCLSGLGVPDMEGTWGTYCLWSDDVRAAGTTETGGRTYFVAAAREPFDLVVTGPPNPRLSRAERLRVLDAADAEGYRRETSLDWTRARRRASETEQHLIRARAHLTAKLRVTLRRGADATVRLQDGTDVVLAPGAWSELLPVSFEASPITTLRGRVRLLLDDAGGPDRPFRLFVAPVQWDLASLPPNVDLTSPRSFAAALAADGPAETIGWPELTNPVKDRLLADRAFLDHTYMVMALRERRLHAQLARKDWDCLFAMFSEPDRVQHALWRHVDPENPLHDPEAAKTFGGEIDRIYAEADRIVADTVRLAGPDAIVLVVSDHGFAPFRRGVNLNNFLRGKGWQTGEGENRQRGVGELALGTKYFTDVDWTRTKAYAMGLGNGYVNVAGREPNGIVPLDQVDAVVDEIARELEALRDEGGARVVRKVYRGKDLYRGARAREAPDFVVGFERGYRVSWQCCLGALDKDVITPNTQPWSGDHCSVDPDHVPAILFSSVPLAVSDRRPTVEDVAPSVLSLFGVAPAPGTDGRSFLAR